MIYILIELVGAWFLEVAQLQLVLYIIDNTHAVCIVSIHVHSIYSICRLYSVHCTLLKYICIIAKMQRSVILISGLISNLDNQL